MAMFGCLYAAFVLFFIIEIGLQIHAQLERE
jgi:hypothetical protein